MGHERDGDWCPWCEAQQEGLAACERGRLLDPPWLRRDSGRYDELSEEDKAVWDRTRGQVRGEHSIETWTDRLVRAVEAGLISETEARRATRKIKGR